MLLSIISAKCHLASCISSARVSGSPITAPWRYGARIDTAEDTLRVNAHDDSSIQLAFFQSSRVIGITMPGCTIIVIRSVALALIFGVSSQAPRPRYDFAGSIGIRFSSYRFPAGQFSRIFTDFISVHAYHFRRASQYRRDTISAGVARRAFS